MPIFESNRKVLTLGNSHVITLPSMYIKVNEIEKGQRMRVHYDLNGVLITSKNDDIEALIKTLHQFIDSLKGKL